MKFLTFIERFALGIFVVSLALPALIKGNIEYPRTCFILLDSCSKGTYIPGYYALLVGFLSFHPAWYANLCMLFSYTMSDSKIQIKLLLNLIAFILCITVFRGVSAGGGFTFSEENLFFKPGIGFYFRIVSFLILTLRNIYVLLESKSVEE